MDIPVIGSAFLIAAIGIFAVKLFFSKNKKSENESPASVDVVANSPSVQEDSPAAVEEVKQTAASAELLDRLSALEARVALLEKKSEKKTKAPVRKSRAKSGD